MIQIALDGNEANVANRVGSNVYAYQLLVQLEKLSRTNREVEWTVLLSSRKLPHLPKRRRGWRYQVIGPEKFWTQWALPLHLLKERKKYSLFFTPGHYAPRLSPVPYISSVMDLAYLHFPEQFKKRDQIQLAAWTKYSVKHAEHVVTISEASKEDIVSSYGVPAGKVSIIYPAADEAHPEPSRARTQSVRQKFGLKGDFILHVGTFQPRKNIVRLIEAFEESVTRLEAEQKKQRRKSKTPPLKLVLAGKEGWLADPIMDKIESSPRASQIVVTGYISDEVKHILLKEAQAVVMVGLYEGFGIPVLEGMMLGTAPIASNLSSLPEVVGDEGQLVDPYSVDSIASGILHTLRRSSRQKAAASKKLKAAARKFSWQTSGQQLLDLLLETASHET